MTIQIIPESAPFNDDQRAWLNGFFVGYLGLEGNVAVESDAVVEEDEEGKKARKQKKQRN